MLRHPERLLKSMNAIAGFFPPKTIRIHEGKRVVVHVGVGVGHRQSNGIGIESTI